MLKVLKYDWKNGWNNVKATLIGAAIVSVLLGLLMGVLGGTVVVNGHEFGVMGDNQMDKVVMVMFLTWFAVMVALLVQTVDAIFRNMNGRMFGPEGYLTHTLPVHTWELLLGKVVGTWLFGVFMVFAAIAAVVLVMAGTAASSGAVLRFFRFLIEAAPKLGAYHFRSLVTGAGYLLYGLLAFLAGSFLIVVQFQFICVAARQFGRYHTAGGIIVFILLGKLESWLDNTLSMGFLVAILVSAACFFASRWLLKNRLSF